MNALSTRKSVLLGLTLAALCAIGVTFATGAPPEGIPRGPGATSPKGPGSKPETVTKVNLDPTMLQLDQPRKPITPNPYTIDDIRRMWGNDKLTPESTITLHNKKQMTVQAYMDQLKVIQDWMNAHGYDLKDPNFPKVGLKMRLNGKGTAALFANQEKTIAAEHKPAAGKVHNAAPPTKADLAADQKLKAAFDTVRRAEVTKALAGLDRSKLDASQQKLFDQLSSGKTITPADASQSQGVRNLFLQHASQLIKSLFPPNDYHKGWNWSFGSADIAEVDVIGDLRLNAVVTLAGGIQSMHARGTVEADGYVFDGSRSNPHKIIEIVTDLASSESSQTLQASAKAFGQDLFTPVNETVKTGDILNINKDLKFDKTVAEGVIPAFGVPVHYKVNVNGEFQYAITGKSTAAAVSINPTAKIGSSLTASADVNLAIIDIGVQGTLNLVNDSLNLSGSIGLGQAGGGPFLETTGSAHDTLKLLGGEIDVVLKVDLGLFTKDLGTLTLFSVSGFQPIDGFVFGPDDIKTPLQPQTKAAAVAESKKK